MIGLLTALFAAVSESLKLLPNYDQRRLDDYHSLLNKYNESLNLTPKDDNYTDWCREKLQQFIDVYAQELRNFNSTPKS